MKQLTPQDLPSGIQTSATNIADGGRLYTFTHVTLGELGRLRIMPHGPTQIEASAECRMPQKLSVTGVLCHKNCPPDPAGPAIFVTACHKNCPGGLSASCTDGLFAAKIVLSLQAVAQKLSVAYTERLLSFLLDGGSTRPLVFPF